MEKTKIDIKLILRICLPIIVFITLMVVGTFFDLNISKALVSNLPSEKYYTSNVGAIFIEVVGFFPIWVAAFFASMVLFRYFYGKKGKLNKILMVAFILGQVAFATFFLEEIFKYGFRFLENEEMTKKIGMLAIYFGFGLLCASLASYFYRNVNEEFNNKLVKMAIVIALSCVFFLLIEVIKSPVGRIRYRAMNELGNFDLYQPWYHIGKSYADGIRVHDDGLKSFPSGHSFSGAMIFVITCLPYCFESLNNKKMKIIFVSVSSVYTCLVMFFRIIAGAHFLTDTVMGAFLAIGPIMLFRYIFLIRKK